MKRNYILMGLGIMLIVSIPFLWGESFSIYQKINSSKVGDYAASIGAILTAVTLVFFYLQIRQMKEDSKAASLPDLYPVGLDLFTEDRMTYDLPQPAFRSMKTDDMKDIFHVDIHNIGLGAAKEIMVDWKFDAIELKEYVGENYYSQDYSLKVDEEEFDFVPTGGIIKKMFPLFYMDCCGINLNQDPRKPKPRLQLEIRFKDIYNHTYINSFDSEIYANGTLVRIKFRLESKN